MPMDTVLSAVFLLTVDPLSLVKAVLCVCFVPANLHSGVYHSVRTYVSALQGVLLTDSRISALGSGAMISSVIRAITLSFGQRHLKERGKRDTLEVNSREAVGPSRPFTVCFT